MVNYITWRNETQVPISSIENICIDIPNFWTDSLQLISTLILMTRGWAGHSTPLVQVMACHLFGTKPLSEPVLAYC